MKIRGKIYMIVLAGGLSAVAVAGTAMYGFYEYQQRVSDLEQTLRRAHSAEKLNRLVTAVVMESRGIYHATSIDKAKPFADGLEGYLKELDALLLAWKPLVPEADRDNFEKLETLSKSFAAFRRDMAQQGITAGPQAADAIGNNDANRANRKAFQALINDQVTATQAAAADIQTQMTAFSSQINLIMLITTLLGLLIGVGLAAYVGTVQLSQPLMRVTRALKRIAGGDLAIVQEERRSRDEIAEIWEAVRQFVHSLRENEELKAEQHELKELTEAEKRQAMRTLADRFESEVMGVVRSVATAAQQLQANATQMNTNADQTSYRSQAVAAASEQTSANVSTVASAAEELSASVRQIGDRVEGSSSIAREASGKAKAAAEAAQGLTVNAGRIGEVVSLISDIAAQTNLLALNATIEAARAGEAGRGFAVVAQEVKGLAEQTAKATGEIAEQVQAVQGTTRSVVGAIDGIGVTIEQINQISDSIAVAVEEQGVAITEIARNVTQAAQGTREVSANIGDVSLAASQTSRGSGEIVSASNELAKQADALRSQVDAFIAKVRAA